jgi:hypothetical protein
MPTTAPPGQHCILLKSESCSKFKNLLLNDTACTLKELEAYNITNCKLENDPSKIQGSKIVKQTNIIDTYKDLQEKNENSVQVKRDKRSFISWLIS